MPRKLTRHRQLVRYKPFGFSPFARSMAHAQFASDNKVKHKNQTQGSKNHYSESSSDDEFEGTIQADFEFFDPKLKDFHGVKVLLRTYLDNKQWDLSGFVELILGQPTVGTVVKVANDEDEGIYSVISVLNLGRYKDNKCMMELKKFLLNACQEKNLQSNLSSLLEEQSKDVGLLVSQRVVNLPPQLLPPLYDALFDEISWATEDEPTEELRKSFCFKFYLVVSKIYKHRNAEKKTVPSKSGDGDIIYVNAEDEILHELSSWSFTFPLYSQRVRTDELKDYRATGLVMVVEASNISKFRLQLHSLIDES